MKLSDFFPEMEGFTPVVSSVAKTPQLPNPETQVTPFLRAPLPLPLQYSGDTIKQYNRPGLSSFRMAPLTPGGSASANAAAKSAISSAITTAISSIPTVSTTDLDIITDINKQSFGSVDNVSFKSYSSPVNSITISGVTSGANDLAIIAGDGRANAQQNFGLTPGAGWTNLAAAPGGFWKVIPAANTALTLTQDVSGGGGSLAASQILAFFKTNGNTPVFTTRGSGTGSVGLTAVSNTFTPAAGNSIIFLNFADSGNSTENFNWTASDGVNQWVQLANPAGNNSVTAPGFPHSSQIALLYAQNVANTSITITVTGDGINSFGTWAFYEISNIGNASSGAYTFLASDANKLVQFSGGSDVSVTLPSPAFAAGWQALVSNNNQLGKITITSAAALNGGFGTSVVLPPGGSTWVFSDGTNYETTTISLPLSAIPQNNKWINSFNAATGAFSQSQPAFSNLSGSLTPAQSQGGGTASFVKFWRGDGFWGGIGSLGVADLGGQGANVATTTLLTTPGASPGLYRVSVYLIISRAASTSSTLPDSRITFTDQNTFGTITVPLTAGNTGNTTSTIMQGSVVISCAANTAIQYDVGQLTPYASSGATSMLFAFHARAEFLG